MSPRDTLKAGSRLAFPGMDIEIRSVVGAGSNAIVYKGSYEDGLTEGVRHTVLVKELFPFHPKGLIFRNAAGYIEVAPEAEDEYELHRRSFERGNEAHLKLLELFPDKTGGNVNTFRANGTFYTVLSESGGRDIHASESAQTLKTVARRLLSLLDALAAFHETNLMHLDISPDNILLVGKGESERCMLIDYNSCFSPEEMKDGNSAYFSVKQGFTAPEIINKNLSLVTWSTDLYSVSAVFFHMLMGRALTLSETLSRNPPDVSVSEYLKDAPETVVAQVKSILKKGLSALPDKRYACVSQMREAFSELMRRIDMLGVTHAALWEAGKKSVLRLIRENPFYAYLSKSEDMFPVRIRMDDERTVDEDTFLQELLSEEGASRIVVSNGGMGKTTLLLKTALSLSKAYSPARPAAVYISLSGKKTAKKDILLDELLSLLRFTEDTVTYDGARHALKALLASPLKNKSGEAPVLILLLDGLNEATGDTALLHQEIEELNRLSGLRILLTSRMDSGEIRFPAVSLSDLTDQDVMDALKKRGLLIPENERIRPLLKTPLMLSMFMQASGDEKRPAPDSESEIMESYIASLLQKEKDASGDSESEKYLIDAAVRYVLCALALRAKKSGGAISETDAFACAKKCRKTLRSQNLSRAFPMWIGHRKDIILSSDDEFYGEIVHNILLRRMGLIVRANGSIKISHANIGEYLARRHAENEKRIQKRKRIAACGWLLLSILLLTGAYASFNHWLKDYVVKVEKQKPAYDDSMAEKCLSYAVSGYADYAILYERTLDAIAHPSVCPGTDTAGATNAKNAIDRYFEPAGSAHTLYIRFIERMMETNGEVVSWSQAPFDAENAERLILFSDECRERYLDACRTLYDVRHTDALTKYAEEYEKALLALINADALLSDRLYRLVCGPHQANMDKSFLTDGLKTIASNTKFQNFLKSDSAQSAESVTLNDLIDAETRREEALTQLDKILYQIRLYQNTGG